MKLLSPQPCVHGTNRRREIYTVVIKVTFQAYHRIMYKSPDEPICQVCETIFFLIRSTDLRKKKSIKLTQYIIVYFRIILLLHTLYTGGYL